MYTFAWSLIWNGLPTMEKINSRFPNWNIGQHCKRCTTGYTETLDHLFLSCSTSKETWLLIINTLHFDPRPAARWWLQEQSAAAPYDPIITLTAIIAIREIWIGRNHSTFRGSPYFPQSIADKSIKRLCLTLVALSDKRRASLAMGLCRYCDLDHGFP